MKATLNLTLSFLLLIAVVGCGSSSSGDGGSGGTAGAGGTGGAGGEGGSAGVGGAAGEGGAGGTGGQGGSGGVDLSPKDLLSEWGLFDDIRNQVPAEGLIPLEVTSPLFTDYALKHRFVTLRMGGQIEYSDDQRWQAPVGTIYVKTFAYPIDMRSPELGEQLIETRLLVHDVDGWKVWVYVYNEDMTDAELTLGGATVSVTWIDENGDEQSVPEYGVPSNGACRKCHGTAPNTRTLGPSTGMLNRDNDFGAGPENQIDHLEALGLLENAPPPEDENNPRITYVDPVSQAETCDDGDFECLHEAARSWLQSNCSHCHAPDGEVLDKVLYLDWLDLDPASEDTTTWGVCKTPTSAGNGVTCTQTVDIFPGDPDRSLLLCRIESITAGEMMAPLGRSTVFTEGADVIRRWIAAMPYDTDPRFAPCSVP
jgi:uncharacterized repeat protein (TIGR03806 family)